MKKLPSIPFAVVYLVLSSAALGQTNVKVDSVPAVGKDVTVEYTLPLGNDQRIQWSVGIPGTIDGDATQTKVNVKPSGPGDIAVSCTVIPPNPDSRTGGCGTTLHVPGNVPGNGTAQVATGATGSVNPVASGSSEPTHPQGQTSTASQTSPGDLDILTEGFTPSGYQGDGQKQGGLIVEEGVAGPRNEAWTKIVYAPPANSIGWAALSWLAPNSDPSHPWGITPGVNYSTNGFLSFRLVARTTKNGTVKFQSGGNTASARDVIASSYSVTGPVVKLQSQFRDYCIPLKSRNLSNVFSPFTVILTEVSNPGGAEIYVTEMHFSQTPC